MALIQRFFSGTNWKHAAAEVALIFIGVTIALWADAWVGAQRDLQRENARLTALYADTEETLAALSVAHSQTSAAATALREILVLQPPYDSYEAIAGLLRHGLLFGLAFHPEMSVYDDLKNSGELALLTDSSLRQALSNMDSGLEQLRMTQADLITVQQLNVDSYMVDHMDLISFYGAMTGIERVRDLPTLDFEFLQDREFLNRVVLKLDLVTQLEAVLAETETRVQEVKDLIESQLGE